MTWPLRKCVIVPVDLADADWPALNVALELVDDPQHVHVLYVLPVIVDLELGMAWSGSSDDERREFASASLNKRLEDVRYRSVCRKVLLGDAGNEVCGQAEKMHADLIVLPSHGRTGMKRLLLGSVAERVVRLAHCPVLVLKSPQPASH
jgi:nucleotide-binding universal stress UspA family protein